MDQTGTGSSMDDVRERDDGTDGVRNLILSTREPIHLFVGDETIVLTEVDTRHGKRLAIQATDAVEILRESLLEDR